MSVCAVGGGQHPSAVRSSWSKTYNGLRKGPVLGKLATTLKTAAAGIVAHHLPMPTQEAARSPGWEQCAHCPCCRMKQITDWNPESFGFYKANSTKILKVPKNMCLTRTL